MELYLDTCVLYSLKVTEIFIHTRLMFYEVLADLRLYSINASQNSFNTLVNTFAWKLMPSVLFPWVGFHLKKPLVIPSWLPLFISQL